MASPATDEAKREAAAAKGGARAFALRKQVGHLLRRAHQRHTAIFQAMIGEGQVTPLQFAVLMTLADMDEASQNHLGRLTAMDAATMQGVIKRLLARGLIRRRADPGDRRRLLLTLSRAGEELVAEVTDRGHAISERTLEPLSAAERKTFLRLLGRLSSDPASRRPVA